MSGAPAGKNTHDYRYRPYRSVHHTATTDRGGDGDRVLPEMMALPKEALVPVNLDVTAAAGVAFGVAHHIPKYRPEVEQRLSAVIHLQAFDKLGIYALALMQANALLRAAARPVNGLRNLARSRPRPLPSSGGR